MKNLLTIGIIILANIFFLFAQDNSFGAKNPELLNLKGAIYFLPEFTESMPKGIENQEPEGYIYTKKLDIPMRNFSEGFPGVTDRYEWFGIVYNGKFEITVPGLYLWRLVSDDGAILWIDGKEVVNNDGIHPFAESEHSITRFAKGIYDIKIWYFQGPAYEIGLQLYITNPSGEEKIFSLEDYSAKLKQTFQKLDIEAKADGIRANLPDDILFDIAKWALKPTAKETISQLAEIIKTYPNARVIIEGHTDSQGEESANQTLSENRAKSVLEGLKTCDIPSTVKFETKGFGETNPRATNETEEGRKQNRRVEVLILP